MNSAKSSRRSDAPAFLIKHVVYPLWVRKNRSAQLKYVAELERSQWWPHKRIRIHQLAALQRLVTHAAAICPYYQQAFKEAGMSPMDIRSLDDLRLLPTISKEQIQEYREEIVSTRYARSELIPDMTGGSTGSPMQFYYSADRRDSRDAAAIRHDRWAGLDIGGRCAVLWGAQRDISTNRKAR